MAFITGCIVLDAPASALNNAGADAGAKTDNQIVVKKIRLPNGGAHAYVSAQAVRYWIRTNLELNEPKWKSAPVRREGKIAYTDAEPITFWDDDLFGYMRAPSKKADAAKDANASPLEKEREITRVSPFRVSTFVSISPAQIISDFGTMTRQQGDPVPYEHEFYRAHLQGLLSLDLTSAGTFFDGARVGFKNLDSYRRKHAESEQLASVTVRNQPAFRLKPEERADRVSTLIASLANLTGGAKQAVHYTDLTPAVIALAVTTNGNNPFYRMFAATKLHQTRFHEEAFKEIVSVYRDQFLSPVFIGWSKGFLDEERSKLEALIASENLSDLISLDHPVTQIGKFAAALRSGQNVTWYD
jgi:CRISPR-associated protein Cst2